MWLIRDDETSRVILELNGETDRAVAIIGASLIERDLLAAIRNHLHDDESIFGELFRSSGPLGSFSAKIKIGHLIGIYRKEVYRDLNLIRTIRNDFAHDLRIKDFADASVADRIREISVVSSHVGRSASEILRRPNQSGLRDIMFEEDPADPRVRYLVACQLLCLRLTAAGDPGHNRSPRPYDF